MINTVKHYDTQRLGDPLPQSASRRSESFKPKLFTVYRQGSSQLTVFPVTGEISVAVQTQREEIDSQESVCIFRMCLFISSHLQKLLSCQGLQGCEASPLMVLAGRASLLDQDSTYTSLPTCILFSFTDSPGVPGITC